MPPDVDGEVDTGPVEHWDSHVWNSRWYEGRFKDLYDRLALPARDRTVSDRMAALGMKFLGPRYPAGWLASPPPQELPPNTLNVPTYHTTRQSPATAQNQLDYAFALRGFHMGVTVRALNSVEEWGASDHCRLLIEVAEE